MELIHEYQNELASRTKLQNKRIVKKKKFTANFTLIIDVSRSDAEKHLSEEDVCSFKDQRGSQKFTFVGIDKALEKRVSRKRSAEEVFTQRKPRSDE